MRLAVLVDDPGIAYGGPKGAAVHVGELTAALAAESVEVLVLVTAIADMRELPPGVTVEALPGPRKGASMTARLAAAPARTAWLSDTLRRWGADALYERVALHTTVGIDAAAVLGIPHLAELNAPLPEEAARYRSLEDPAAARELERQVLAASDVVLAVSAPLARYATERGARRVEVGPNAVDPARFARVADAGSDPPTAVFTGRLRPWHGAATLAEAWALLGPSAPTLLVVGDGDGRDRLEAVGARSTGTVAHGDVPELLAGAHIGVVPYPADAPSYFSPLKLFEYLAAGLAVVAADLPGVRSVAGDVAVLVPPGDPQALADAVAGLAADADRRACLGVLGRQKVLAHHTWGHRARRVVELARRQVPSGAPR